MPPVTFSARYLPLRSSKDNVYVTGEPSFRQFPSVMEVAWQKMSSPPESGLMNPKPREFQRKATPFWVPSVLAPPSRPLERERERERERRRSRERERERERRGGERDPERGGERFAAGEGDRSDILKERKEEKKCVKSYQATQNANQRIWPTPAAQQEARCAVAT